VVLIVDDYRDCREMYAAYLALAGFRVLKAADGPTALKLARAEQPDLILMDLGLPGIDGFEVTRLLKRDAVTSSLPVAALTAQPILGSEDSLSAFGFETVIAKPCLPDELARQVERLVQDSRSRTGFGP
jgi:two-component system alkaline phosphatase synthesis response regulator PhoP